MRALPLLFVLASAAARAEAPVVDDALRSTLIVLDDGKHHRIALSVADGKSRLFYSDGDPARYVAVPTDPSENTGAMPDGSWKRSFLDPRFPPRNRIKDYRDIGKSVTAVSYAGGKYLLQCGERKTALQPVVPPALATARFSTRVHQRPYALARDTRGRYYYVDRGDTPLTEKAFRLFVGEKGALKKLKMTNVVSDSEGDIFSTPGGKLRLILSANESTWIEPEETRKLTLVPIDDNQPMIWNELGIYVGEKLGTPCDDL